MSERVQAHVIGIGMIIIIIYENKTETTKQKTFSARTDTGLAVSGKTCVTLACVPR